MDLKKLDYITAPEEWIEDILEKSSKTSPSKAFWRKYGSIAAMIGFFLLCSTSVTVAAMKSTAFQTWLENIFGSGNVKEVVLTTPTALPTADVKARDNTVPFQENPMVAGKKESFVCEYHFVGDEEQIDQVYTVVSDGLKKMTPSTFEGEYNGTKFGFQYVISGNEIFAFNYTGGMSEVFFYYDKDTVYGARTDGDKKEYLLKINLSQNTVEKISNDHMLCNFVMSPSGTKLLCNHRGDAYWSVFDVKTHTEKKIDTALVNGYARTSDIEFLDEDHILTYGESVFMGEDENYETYCINLDTLKIEKKYNGTGEIDMKWDYRYDKKTKTLKFLDLVNGTSATIPDVSTTGQIVAAKGDYVIFGDIDMEDDTFYLVNLSKKSWKKIDIPKEFRKNMEMHIVNTQKKILVTNSKKAYLVDVSSL